MNRRSILILILILSALLTACTHKNTNIKDGKTVSVYYIDSKTSGLAGESYHLISTKTEDQVNELLYMLKKTPKNMAYKIALPESTEVDFKFDKNSLNIDFNEAYSELSNVDGILCRAAIVKTLSQIKDVKFFQFSVNDQPLKEADGDYVKSLTSEDFIDNTQTSTSYKVKLYFANKKGDALIEYLTDINYTGKESIEERVIQQLINGPTKIGMYSTIPEGTTLLNVSKADGICTVDFNEKFLEKLPNVNENIAIYSIVNTLVELPDINKVQFTINGEVHKKYWENERIDAPFEGKLGLIENPN